MRLTSYSPIVHGRVEPWKTTVPLCGPFEVTRVSSRDAPPSHSSLWVGTHSPDDDILVINVDLFAPTCLKPISIDGVKEK